MSGNSPWRLPAGATARPLLSLSLEQQQQRRRRAHRSSSHVRLWQTQEGLPRTGLCACPLSMAACSHRLLLRAGPRRSVVERYHST